MRKLDKEITYYIIATPKSVRYLKNMGYKIDHGEYYISQEEVMLVHWCRRKMVVEDYVHQKDLSWIKGNNPNKYLEELKMTVRSRRKSFRQWCNDVR